MKERHAMRVERPRRAVTRVVVDRGVGRLGLSTQTGNEAVPETPALTE
jgi:hypothetical protein